jgi:hypothetical protein
MAVWFARTTGNINTVNKWNSAADGSGSWLTWPPASGDVLMANGLSVTVNVSTDLGTTGQVRNDSANGATTGGGFTLSAGTSLTANVFGGGSAQCVLASSGTSSIVGNVTGSNQGNDFYGARCNGGSLNVTGNVVGGTSTNSYGIRHDSTGTLSVVGSVTGGSGNGAVGVWNLGAGTVNITGAVTGTTQRAIQNNALGTINITGDVTAGSAVGARNGAGGTINITGNAIAAAANAADNAAAGTLTVSGYAQASTAVAALNNIAQGILQVGETRSASNGRGAVVGAFRYASATAAKTMPYTPDGQISMTVLDVAAIVPAVGDVRKGLVYGDGAYTGALPLGRNRTSMAGRF